MSKICLLKKLADLQSDILGGFLASQSPPVSKSGRSTVIIDITEVQMYALQYVLYNCGLECDNDLFHTVTSVS